MYFEHSIVTKYPTISFKPEIRDTQAESPNSYFRTKYKANKKRIKLIPILRNIFHNRDINIRKFTLENVDIISSYNDIFNVLI